MNPIPDKSLLSETLNAIFSRLFILFTALLLSFCASAQGSGPESKEIKISKDPEKNADKILYGLASFYAQKFDGRKTANGEIFSHAKYTAACNVLPLGTWVKVTNLKNNKVIIVRTNDRLHPKTRRILDLTYTGAKDLGFIKNGLTRVKIEILNQKKYKKLASK